MARLTDRGRARWGSFSSTARRSPARFALLGTGTRFLSSTISCYETTNPVLRAATNGRQTLWDATGAPFSRHVSFGEFNLGSRGFGSPDGGFLGKLRNDGRAFVFTHQAASPGFLSNSSSTNWDGRNIRRMLGPPLPLEALASLGLVDLGRPAISRHQPIVSSAPKSAPWLGASQLRQVSQREPSPLSLKKLMTT